MNQKKAKKLRKEASLIAERAGLGKEGAKYIYKKAKKTF